MDLPYLLRRGLVPPPSIPEIPTKRYPNWVYQEARNDEDIFAKFDLFTRESVRKALMKEMVDYQALWKGLNSTEPRGGIKPLDLEGWLRAIFPESPCYNGDFFHEEGWLVFVVVAPNPGKDKEGIMLRACINCLLGRDGGLKTDHVGVLLPLQRTGFWIDFSSWDESGFREVYEREKLWKKKDGEVTNFPFVADYGRHMRKEDALHPSFKTYPQVSQIFLTSPRSRTPISKKDLETIKENLPEHPVFAHGRYIYNLCSTEPWMVEGLAEELEGGKFVGLSGVVFHCGKSKKISLGAALDNMEINIRKVLAHATEDCPLLLETSARQGSEVLSHLDDLIDFYGRFGEMSKFRLVVDTAHVHGAGYDPLYFLERLEERFPGSVALVHFNDSSVPRSSCIDRHHSPGMGYLGYKRMEEVFLYCLAHSIPMVYE